MRRLTFALLLATLASAQQAGIPDANTIGVFRWDPSGTQPNACSSTQNPPAILPGGSTPTARTPLSPGPHRRIRTRGKRRRLACHRVH